MGLGTGAGMGLGTGLGTGAGTGVGAVGYPQNLIPLMAPEPCKQTSNMIISTSA
jgi:hypothetical protein